MEKIIEKENLLPCNVLALYKNDINAPIWRCEKTKELVLRGFKGSIIENPQHLYFTSTREMKEGDYQLIFMSGKYHIEKYMVENGRKHFSEKFDSSGLIFRESKIEATTDPELTKGWIRDNDPLETDPIHINVTTMDGVPKIDKSFVEKYVKAQGDIKQVNLELLPITEEQKHGIPINKYTRRIKTDTKNTVFTHNAK